MRRYCYQHTHQDVHLRWFRVGVGFICPIDADKCSHLVYIHKRSIYLLLMMIVCLRWFNLSCGCANYSLISLFFLQCCHIPLALDTVSATYGGSLHANTHKRSIFLLLINGIRPSNFEDMEKAHEALILKPKYEDNTKYFPFTKHNIHDRSCSERCRQRKISIIGD